MVVGQNALNRPGPDKNVQMGLILGFYSALPIFGMVIDLGEVFANKVRDQGDREEDHVQGWAFGGGIANTLGSAALSAVADGSGSTLAAGLGGVPTLVAAGVVALAVAAVCGFQAGCGIRGEL